MTAMFDTMSEMLNGGINPYAGRGGAPTRNFQGWNSHHPYLRGAVQAVRPRVIVEVGVWKGMSLMEMALAAKQMDLDCVAIGIDTWLGSAEHRSDPQWMAELKIINGYPSFFDVMINNVITCDLTDYVLPIPIDSLNAARLIAGKGIKADVLHIDAGHDYHSVSADLRAWWPVLVDGGTLIGDDYFEDGAWPEVHAAFRDFLGVTPHHDFRHEIGKCILRKAF